ncbi:MAG: DUF2723 domain-containing protein [Bacteroidia bacterium]|nr:DUF2723 domain-containing protein [Bacteroidia bacterium]MDW8088753.1 DUF2723 domain-containing protein [Bacteroidia bacterium]
MEYNRQRWVFGGIVFGVALLTYGLTVAPTASFWDCGEFIATANELEVPHPPGAPLYLVLARLFALLAPSSDKVAYFVNWLSVLAGAFTALLASWITMHFVRKSVAEETSLRVGFSGLLAGLTATFADSVWFNTVEAEVYAPSALFTTLVIWLMCVWEDTPSLRRQNQLLILIAFIFGLSIGVHLLNLLTLPGLALMYYFRKTDKPNWKGALLAFTIGGAILGFLQYGVIQYTVSLAWPLEEWLVGVYYPAEKKTTGIGLPFGSGLAVFIVILFTLLALLVRYAHQKQSPVLSTAALSLLFIYLGYSTYAVIFLRSQVKPPINENDPSTVPNFLSYLRREQYGEVPILWGPLYNADPISYEPRGKIYLKYPGTDRYTYEGQRLRYAYDPRDYRFFPRMWSPAHYRDNGPFSYINYVKNRGFDPNSPFDDKPTGLENLRFFFDYQLYHMYIRYFLMNFVGRESEEQDSRWESGLEFRRLRHLPAHRKKDASKAHYYGLPLLLGLLGMSWHYQRRRSHFWVLLTLFLFTGVAIIIYLNQYPNQPRERDYSYAGSFIMFALWVGMSAAAVAEKLEKWLGRYSEVVAGLPLLGVPLLMAVKNWRSHSRAGNYVPPDSAYNFLMSCPPNAILFTNGDNDTFPLWYLQEVEGIRTDVRIVNLSLLNTDWYISQLKYQTHNGAPPVPIKMPDVFWMGEKRDQILIKPGEEVMDQPIPKEEFLKNYPEAYRYTIDQLADTLYWRITPRKVPGAENKSGGYLNKQDYMTIHIILANIEDGWRRPICFANTLPQYSYLDLFDYLYMRGMVYELLPLKPKGPSRRSSLECPIQDSLTHHLLTQVFRYRNLNRSDIFYDSNTRRMIANYRSVFQHLAGYYLDQADTLSDSSQAQGLRQKARNLLAFMEAHLSSENLPLEPSQLYMQTLLWYRAGDTLRAQRSMQSLVEMVQGELAYAKAQRLPPEDRFIWLAGALVYELPKKAPKLDSLFHSQLQRLREEAEAMDYRRSSWRGE